MNKKNNKRTSLVWRIDEKVFKNEIKESISMANFLRKIGLNTRGGNYITAKKRLKELGLDTSHWVSRHDASNFTRKMDIETFEKEWLVNGKERHSNEHLKRYILQFELIAYICEKCSNSGKWEGDDLVLQLDHKDGDRKNNELSNLRFLCPNCHSQTDTFCTRRWKKEPSKERLGLLLKDKSLGDIKKETGISVSRIKRLATLFGLDITRNMHRKGKIQDEVRKKNAEERGASVPTKDELEKLVWEMPTTKLKERFKVSDVAIAKWCKGYDITKPPRGYWARRKAGLSHEDALKKPKKYRSTKKADLTKVQVCEIKHLIAEGELSLRKIGKRFDRSYMTIADIRDNKIEIYRDM